MVCNDKAWNGMVFQGMGYYGIEQLCSNAEEVYEQHMDMDITWVLQKHTVNARLRNHLAALTMCLLAIHRQSPKLRL